MLYLNLCLLLCIPVIDGAFIGEVQWNISNPLFKHDLDGQGAIIQACLMDYFVFSCPYWSDPDTNPVIFQYLVVHSVSEYEFEKCKIDLRNADNVGLVCLSPDRNTDPHTVMFDDPKLVGTVQHYITTSTGNKEGWDQIVGGLCLKEHMKFRVEILDQDCDRKQVTQHNYKILAMQRLPKNQPINDDPGLPVDQSEITSGIDHQLAYYPFIMLVAFGATIGHQLQISLHI